MVGQNSIQTTTPTTEVVDTVVREYSRPQTPYQVLRLLPKDATPAQQDSAIQAWMEPVEIHYSEQPDTLHLPGHGIGRNLKEVNLPQYYRENFFSEDTLYHSELQGGRYGVAGDPLPYNVSSDNIISGLLLACFVITMLTFSICRNFILRHCKYFFYLSKADDVHEVTQGEIRGLAFYMLQATFMLTMLYLYYVRTQVADTFILDDQYILTAIVFVIILGYFICKLVLYSVVNLTFFNGKKNRQWFQITLFLTAAEGVLLYPAVLLMAYFSINPQTIFIYTAIIVILVKILAFYKCFAIFFRQNGLFLQIILYFCALEIAPLLALGGGLELLINALKINF